MKNGGGEVARVKFHEMWGFGEKSDQIPIYGRFELHGHFPPLFRSLKCFSENNILIKESLEQFAKGCRTDF